jgi:Secretion system C-terminal sorting domain
MKKIILLLVCFLGLKTNAQPVNELLTVVSKYNTATMSGTVRLGIFNPNIGLVSNIGTSTSSNVFNVTGGALNQVTNKFNLASINSIISFDLSDGTIEEIPVTSFYTGQTYLSNIRYNISDNSLYCLASTFTGNNNFTGMYLSKFNTETGVLNSVSQNSIGTGYQLAGNAIDPLQMVYYYSTGSTFMGLDLYTGGIYSNPTITFSNPNEYNFSNFTYNCADNTTYGLVTENTQIPNPNFPFPVNIYKMRLGKINPTTGVVTTISETPLPTSSYSVNAGSTIDPDTNIYYYSDGAIVYGISLITGLQVSASTLTYEDGQQINTIVNYNNCLGATSIRANPLLSISKNELDSATVFPNPAENLLNIATSLKIDSFDIYDINSRKVNVPFLNESTLNIQNLQAGVYFLKISNNTSVKTIKFVKK